MGLVSAQDFTSSLHKKKAWIICRKFVETESNRDKCKETIRLFIKRIVSLHLVLLSKRTQIKKLPAPYGIG